MLTAIVLASCLAFAFGADICQPDQKTLYWTPTCTGQTFENRITATNVTVMQNGQLVDDRGGLDLEVPINIIATIVNNYGTTTTPKVDLLIYQYAIPDGGTTCTWNQLPTFGMLSDLDACTMIENCHNIFGSIFEVVYRYAILIVNSFCT
jgi:hypothetical protein